MFKSLIAATALMLGFTSFASAGEPVVVVNGSGVVYAKPDCLHVHVNIVGEHANPGKAYSLNKGTGEKVFAAIKKNKVEEADVSSVGFQFSRNYENGKETNYVVVHSLVLKVKDLKLSGALLDDVVESGGQLNGIYYAISNRDELVVKARSLAVADAKAKAEQLAAGAGYKLRNLVTISEGSSYGGTEVYRASSARLAEGAGGVKLAPGSQAVTVDVHATWDLIVK